MKDFKLRDFINLLKRIKDTYPSLDIDVERFEKNVTEDLDEQVVYKVEDTTQVKSIVPNQFIDKKVEFLVVYHFKQQFLDPVIESEFIIREFSKVREISSISIQNAVGEAVDYLPVKKIDSRKLFHDTRFLLLFFREMAVELLGNDFDIYSL